MAALDLTPFPLVQMHPIANGRNEWVALGLDLRTASGNASSLPLLFGSPDLLAAIAPLDCVLRLDGPAQLPLPLLSQLPPQRAVLVFDGACLAQDGAARQLAALQEEGYRILLDGALPPGVARPSTLRGVAFDCSAGMPAPGSLLALFGPHLAYGIGDERGLRACEKAGFAWFGGAHLARSCAGAGANDLPTRRRLLGLLALLARDADSRELENVLKQDPVLSYHLLKLVNSAAFAVNTRITGFAQAIALLGRRQLQRWLQLLLYARTEAEGPLNPLLPLAALRAARLEVLCKRDGGDRDEQDLAFMTGAFSLLDHLLGMHMAEIVGELCLPDHVEAALLRREGLLGARLRLMEGGATHAAALAAAGVDPASWWSSQLHAYHWAIQVGRNV
ncbi:MAG: HDOD domain-containing protein [Pseudomonadota bacterium]